MFSTSSASNEFDKTSSNVNNPVSNRTIEETDKALGSVPELDTFADENSLDHLLSLMNSPVKVEQNIPKNRTITNSLNENSDNDFSRNYSNARDNSSVVSTYTSVYKKTSSSNLGGSEVQSESDRGFTGGGPYSRTGPSPDIQPRVSSSSPASCWSASSAVEPDVDAFSPSPHPPEKGWVGAGGMDGRNEEYESNYQLFNSYVSTTVGGTAGTLRRYTAEE